MSRSTEAYIDLNWKSHGIVSLPRSCGCNKGFLKLYLYFNINLNSIKYSHYSQTIVMYINMFTYIQFLISLYRLKCPLQNVRLQINPDIYFVYPAKVSKNTKQWPKIKCILGKFFEEQSASDFHVSLCSHLSQLINPDAIKKLASNTSQEKNFYSN